MDSTHLHLILNHFPIIGTLIGTGVMAYGYYSGSYSTKKAALMIWVAMALVAIPVFLTGEPAEESVEHLLGVSEPMIEAHEEAAELALWVMEALGVLSLLAIFSKLIAEKHQKTFILAAFVLSLLTFGAMARTGYLGGLIRHSEIRDGAAGQPPADNGADTETEGDDD